MTGMTDINVRFVCHVCLNKTVIVTTPTSGTSIVTAPNGYRDGLRKGSGHEARALGSAILSAGWRSVVEQALHLASTTGDQKEQPSLMSSIDISSLQGKMEISAAAAVAARQ